MGKYNLEGASINARKLHIGDEYYYSTPKIFLDNQSELELTETETELVKIIFENTSSEAERQNILRSLKSIKSEEDNDNVKEKSFFSFKPLLQSLRKSGNRVAEQLLTKFIKTQLESNNLPNLVDQLLD
jgi:hypothetical protein